jgi:protein gp37
MAEYLRGVGLGADRREESIYLRREAVLDAAMDIVGPQLGDDAVYAELKRSWPLPNVWAGTSIEDQAAADERIPHLLRTPAAVRFISAEPLLGPVELRQSWKDYLEGWDTEAECCGRPDRWGGCCGMPDPAQVQTERINWVIVGGESGPGARPMHPDWARSLRDQCQAAGVPFFFKQWGAWAEVPAVQRQGDLIMADTEGRYGMPVMRRVGKKEAGRELAGRTWDEFPALQEART